MSIKVAIQVPIKMAPSERVPGKNFREIAGHPLAYFMLNELLKHCPEDWMIVIDTEDASALEKHRDDLPLGSGLVYERPKHLAEKWANGNHLLWNFANAHPGFDIYAQAFVTAPCLRGETVVEAIGKIAEPGEGPAHFYKDSVMIGRDVTGWMWNNCGPVNYTLDLPAGLPRSQDAKLWKESTGLYAVNRQPLLERGCRVGERPLLHVISEDEMVDVDTEEDLAKAEEILMRRQR